MRGKIAFVTCGDLSRYFVSKKNPLLTHDDQIAFDFLQDHGWHVEALPWGSDLEGVVNAAFDLLIIRSPWDYMDTEATRRGFFTWLQDLSARGVRIANAFELLKWSLDKHYLQDFANLNIPIVPTVFLEADASLDKIHTAQKGWGRIVVKPCISAAAKDTFLLNSTQDFEDLRLGRGKYSVPFEDLRKGRAFMVQPFLEAIQTEGEWSLVFLNEQYSHSVLKVPKKGSWLVQDELGGSVHCLEAPQAVRDFAEGAFEKLLPFLAKSFPDDPYLLYARVDIVPGMLVGEIEVVEPELFFLDRRTHSPNLGALEKFHRGILTLMPHTLT